MLSTIDRGNVGRCDTDGGSNLSFTLKVNELSKNFQPGDTFQCTGVDPFFGPNDHLYMCDKTNVGWNCYMKFFINAKSVKIMIASEEQ